MFGIELAMAMAIARLRLLGKSGSILLLMQVDPRRLDSCKICRDSERGKLQVLQTSSKDAL